MQHTNLFPRIRRSIAAALVGTSLTALAFGQVCTITVPGTFPTIQQAINNAFPGDVICVAPGTYFENLTIASPHVDFTITGTWPLTIIDGGGLASVITMTGPQSNSMVLQNLIIQNGSDIQGGGVHVAPDSRPTLRNSTIRNCSATFGGGLYVDMTSTTMAQKMKVSRVVFENNIASQDGGGALIEGLPFGVGSSGPGTPHITFNLCQFDFNFAENRGGGLAATGAPFVEVRQSWWETNRAGISGGGVAVYTPDEVLLPSFRVVFSSLHGNSAGFNGGGIYANGAKAMSAFDTTFDYDTCDVGSGMGGHVYATDQGLNVNTYVTQNCLFVNGYGDSGGAIAIDDAKFTIQLCTFDQNAAIFGGALYTNLFTDPVNVTNSILWQDSAVVPHPVTGSQEYYEIGNPISFASCDIAGATIAGNISLNPVYATSLAGSWTPVPNYYLDQALSPCVNAGNQSVPIANLTTTWTTDPAVPSTPDSGIVDMGFHYPPN